jgi:fido (protein-threonine AMPylation protein)
LILYELTNTEQHPLYQALEIANGNRQYDFLRSIVSVSIGAERPFLSQTIIKALNFQAIACLHTSAGEYRPCQVCVGDHMPPQHYRVQALMDDFVNTLNHAWTTTDAVVLATYALWRLNNIHPFINGNGRTARAAAYFVLCVKAGGWLPGEPILPELIRQNRDHYVTCLRHAHASFANGAVDLGPLHTLISKLIDQQIVTVPAVPTPSADSEAPLPEPAA